MTTRQHPFTGPPAALFWGHLGQQRADNCTPNQLKARESFDLEATMAALPAASAPRESEVGAVGVRLRGYLRADIADDLLREYAAETLGALRCSEQYLDALRVVLGNQADAEQRRYVLELNTRVAFASERTMRTIIQQMADAGLTRQRCTRLGAGRRQTLHFIDNSDTSPPPRTDEAAIRDLEAMDRRQETADDHRRRMARTVAPSSVPACITAADVPY